ncbi:MAG: gamma carbonic anhydrase family protein [Candidatus Solibacter usitatus]|nr:gamma carbonic anhydrase family protein [Candidatus Solibacter usitatus]
MIRSYRGISPRIAESSYIDPSAQIIGDVVIGERSSVWPNSTIRGDVHFIRIGDETNVQDNCCLHVQRDEFALLIGNRVSVAHSVTLHGCVIEDECLIGIGAIVLNGARVGSGSIIAAGALVPEGMQVPSGSVLMGVPGKVRRAATGDDRRRIRKHADSYIQYREIYRKEAAS